MRTFLTEFVDFISTDRRHSVLMMKLWVIGIIMGVIVSNMVARTITTNFLYTTCAFLVPWIACVALGLGILFMRFLAYEAEDFEPIEDV